MSSAIKNEVKKLVNINKLSRYDRGAKASLTMDLLWSNGHFGVGNISFSCQRMRRTNFPIRPQMNDFQVEIFFIYDVKRVASYVRIKQLMN